MPEYSVPPAPYASRTAGPVPAQSFKSVQIGTTPTFVLPAGLLELQMRHQSEALLNDPGVCSLQDSSGNTLVSTNQAVGQIPGSGSVYYWNPAEATFQINVTTPTAEVTVYLTPLTG